VWSASRLSRALSPEKWPPGTHCTGGWVGPRAGLDTEDGGKILCPWRGSNPDRPVVQPVVRHYTDWATRRVWNSGTKGSYGMVYRHIPAHFEHWVQPPAVLPICRVHLLFHAYIGCRHRNYSEATGSCVRNVLQRSVNTIRATVQNFRLSHMYCMPRPPPWFDHSNMWLKAQITKLLLDVSHTCFCYANLPVIKTFKGFDVLGTLQGRKHLWLVWVNAFPRSASPDVHCGCRHVSEFTSSNLPYDACWVRHSCVHYRSCFVSHMQGCQNSVVHSSVRLGLIRWIS
jgi:hypothetical protein